MGKTAYKSLYVKYSEDDFKLPIAIADSPSKLDDILGFKRNTTSCNLSRQKRGIIPLEFYAKIDYTEEEWNNDL